MTKTQTNPEEEIKQLEKMHEYLKARKEIFDFAIGRNVLIVFLFYFSVITLIIWLGGGSYIDHRVKGRVEERISEKIDEEYTYLNERNAISELGDTAISTLDVGYYEELNAYLSSKKPQRIRTAAKAELLRITSYLSTWGYQPFDPRDAKESRLSAGQLHELYLQSDSMDKKMAALFFLTYRFNKETPDFLLDIAKSTENLRLRYVALSTLQTMLKEFSANTLDYDENCDLWTNNKEEFYERIEDHKGVMP